MNLKESIIENSEVRHPSGIENKKQTKKKADDRLNFQSNKRNQLTKMASNILNKTLENSLRKQKLTGVTGNVLFRRMHKIWKDHYSGLGEIRP